MLSFICRLYAIKTGLNSMKYILNNTLNRMIIRAVDFILWFLLFDVESIRMHLVCT